MDEWILVNFENLGVQHTESIKIKQDAVIIE